LRRDGFEHRGIYLQWPHERHHLDFVDLTGRSVWIYGQTELQKDLVAARHAAGQQIEYEISDTALHDVATDRPYVTFRDATRRPQRLDADVIVGCDGSHGPSRDAIPVLRTWERTYPFAWLGVLAAVAPSTDELIYAWHPDGFALHSMRSHTISRLYLQVAPEEDLEQWSDQRIWDALGTRLGHGQDGWTLTSGPILEKSVLPMRSHVATPMRHHRLFLAGDAAHIVPPTGAKGLNLAVADVRVLAEALGEWYSSKDETLLDAYSDTALRRVWRASHFSWTMTTMLHVDPDGDPFDEQLALSHLRLIESSESERRTIAENYRGLALRAT
jgi:p-hydroxybenzoate 3-monooxygenase